MSRAAFQAPRKFKIHQAHRYVGESTFTLNSEYQALFSQTVRLPRFHSAGRLQGSCSWKWCTTGVKNCWCPRARFNLGLWIESAQSQPLQARDQCSFPAPKPECRVGNPAPVPLGGFHGGGGNISNKNHLRGCTEAEPGVPGLRSLRD